jgi:hypothetical protein
MDISKLVLDAVSYNNAPDFGSPWDYGHRGGPIYRARLNAEYGKSVWIPPKGSRRVRTLEFMSFYMAEDRKFGVAMKDLPYAIKSHATDHMSKLGLVVQSDLQTQAGFHNVTIWNTTWRPVRLMEGVAVCDLELIKI